MKTMAYSHRDKIRDLYDIIFIGLKYGNIIEKRVLDILREALEYKGIDYYEYIIETQPDDLIDKDKLGYDLLELMSILNLN